MKPSGALALFLVYTDNSRFVHEGISRGEYHVFPMLASIQGEAGVFTFYPMTNSRH